MEAAEYAHEALNAEFEEHRIDRLRARAHLLPGHVLEGGTDLREPIGATHPLRVAEAVTRLGGSPLDDETVEALEDQVLRLLEPRVPRRAPTRTPTRFAAWPAGSSSGSTAWASGAAITRPSTTWRAASPATTARWHTPSARRSLRPGCSSRSRASASATCT